MGYSSISLSRVMALASIRPARVSVSPVPPHRPQAWVPGRIQFGGRRLPLHLGQVLTSCLRTAGRAGRGGVRG